MNKKDLVAAVAKQFAMPKVVTDKVITAVLDNITKALKKGDAVQFVGFGTFSVKKRAARKGRNPKTGAVIKIPASKAISFKSGAKLKASVNKKK